METFQTLYPYYNVFKTDKISLCWNNLLLEASCHPELQAAAEHFIHTALGYVPHKTFCVHHASFIRTLLYQFKNGLISKDECTSQLTPHLKAIRNEQMQKEKRTRAFNFKDFEVYQNVAQEHQDKVRNLLTKFLGYEPNLEYSLESELILRLCCMVDDNILLQDYDASMYYAATITLYRECFLTKGEEAASQLPLLGYNKNHNRLFSQV